MSLLGFCQPSINFHTIYNFSEPTDSISIKVGLYHHQGVYFQTFIRWLHHLTNMAAVIMNRIFWVQYSKKTNKATFSHQMSFTRFAEAFCVLHIFEENMEIILILILWFHWTKLNQTLMGWFLCCPYSILCPTVSVHPSCLLLLKIENSFIISRNYLKLDI